MSSPFVFCLLLAANLFHAGGTRPVAPESVTPADGVRDPVFAYLIGLIDAGLYGTVDAADIQAALARADRPSLLPYKVLSSLTRAEEAACASTVHGAFVEPLALTIPYRILGYAPGRLRTTDELRLREWHLGEFAMDYRGPKGPEVVEVHGVRLFGLVRGRAVVDIDGWLDGLVGGKIDDTRITGLALFTYAGERWGMAVGYNRDYKGRSGLLNFREDKIRFPSPAPLKNVGWKFRQVLEGLEPSLRPDSLQARGAW